MCSSICWEENRAWMTLSLIGASPTELLLTSVYLLLPYDCRHLFQSKWWFLLSVAFSLGPVQCVSLIPMMSMILKVISLATCAMLPLLYSVRTFQFPIFTMFWGCTSGLFSSVASCWTGHSVPLIKWISLLLVSVITGFYRRGLSALSPTWVTRGSPLVWSLSFDLVEMGAP